MNHMKRLITVQDEEGKQLEQFYFDMPKIRNVGHWVDGFWSFEPLNEALTKRLSFTDRDAHVEVDGHSLMFEFKRSFFKSNDGQLMTAVRQAKFQRTSTWFIEGDRNNPKYMVMINETGVDGGFWVSDLLPIDKESLNDYIRKWELWARKYSLVKGMKKADWDAVQDIKDRFHEVRG